MDAARYEKKKIGCMLWKDKRNEKKNYKPKTIKFWLGYA